MRQSLDVHLAKVEDNSAFGGTDFNSPPGEPPKDWAEDLPF